MSQDVSTNDLMQVMKEGFAHADAKVTKRFTELVEAINILSDSTDERFNRLEARTVRIESTMVTKDYLDEKLFDLRGDAVAMIRRHERKFHLRTV